MQVRERWLVQAKRNFYNLKKAAIKCYESFAKALRVKLRYENIIGKLRLNEKQRKPLQVDDIIRCTQMEDRIEVDTISEPIYGAVFLD